MRELSKGKEKITLGICMRTKHPFILKNKYMDWGFHYSPDIPCQCRILGYHAPLINLEKEEEVLQLADLILNLKSKTYLTLHIHKDGAVKNKNLLIEHIKFLNSLAKKREILLCLENLSRGFSSNPFNLMEIAEETDTFITLDIGHIDYEKRKNFIKICKSRIYNAHVYEIEQNGYHLPPKDLKNLGPVLELLIEHGCKAFLIELMNLEEALKTERLVRKFLNRILIKSNIL